MSQEEVSWKTLILLSEFYKKVGWPMPETFDQAVASLIKRIVSVRP